MTKGPQIGHVGTEGHGMANDEVSQHLPGGQGQVDGPQIPLLGHRNDTETQIEHKGEI